MQPSIYQQEPNLIGEAYRNHIVQLPRRFEKYYDFIGVNQDGIFLLGTSNMTGRIWSGSVWLFKDISVPPDVEKCIAGLEFETGIPVGQWFNRNKIVLGSDFGSLTILSLTTMEDVKKYYLSTLAVVCEHDDTVTSIDVTTDSNKFLSGSMDMNIKIWDVETSTSERTYDCAHTEVVSSVRFQPGRHDVFISTSPDGNSLIWDTSLDKPASLILKADSGYMSSCWIDDNCIALGANCGTVSLVDLRMKAEMDRNFCSKRPIYNMAYTKDTQLLAVCADDPTVRVFDCSKNLLNNIYECERHEDFVRGLTWKTPNQLYSCGWDSKILLHDVESKVSMDVNGTAKNEKEDNK